MTALASAIKRPERGRAPEGPLDRTAPTTDRPVTPGPSPSTDADHGRHHQGPRPRACVLATVPADAKIPVPTLHDPNGTASGLLEALDPDLWWSPYCRLNEDCQAMFRRLPVTSMSSVSPGLLRIHERACVNDSPPATPMPSHPRRASGTTTFTERGGRRCILATSARRRHRVRRLCRDVGCRLIAAWGQSRIVHLLLPAQIRWTTSTGTAPGLRRLHSTEMFAVAAARLATTAAGWPGWRRPSQRQPATS